MDDNFITPSFLSTAGAMIASHWVSLETDWPPIAGKESKINLGLGVESLVEIGLDRF